MKSLFKFVIILFLGAYVYLLNNYEVQANETQPVKKTAYSAKFETTTSKLMVASVQSAHDQTYQNILTALKSLKDTATFPANQIFYTEVGSIIDEVLADHPEIFYFQYKGTYFYSDGSIELKYKYSKTKIKQMVKQLNSEVNHIINTQIKTKTSDFEKVKALHDYIVLNSKYDYANYLRGSIPDLSFTAYGLLINKVAVCDGYAKAMNLILNKSGIKTYYVTGYGGSELHAWNLVQINKKYYYMDITWDDPVPDYKGHISYKYFLVSASDLKKDHSWNEQVFPAATSNQYDYFQDFYNVQETKTYYYYSNNEDDKLYRIKKDGSNKTKILNVRAPYFAISNQTIYFSNYSDGGSIYKAKLNGSGLKRLKNVYSADLYIEKKYLYYTNKSTGKLEKMKIL